MARCPNCGRKPSASAGCPEKCVNRGWYTKERLKLGRRVSYNITSHLLGGLEVLANETIRGEWFYTLDERVPQATYYGPFRTKEKAERDAMKHADHWKKRLWYL